MNTLPGLSHMQWCTVFSQAKCNASFRKRKKSSQLKMGIDYTGFNWTEALNCSHKRYELEEQKSSIKCGNVTHGGRASL